MRYMLPCDVRFLDRALDSVHWEVTYFLILGVGTLSAT